MAKQTRLENPFRKTTGQEPEPGDNADLDEGRIVSAGVGITQGELEALDRLASEADTSRNALMHLAIRKFIEMVRAGKIDLEAEFEEPERPKKRLKFRQQAKRGG